MDFLPKDKQGVDYLSQIIPVQYSKEKLSPSGITGDSASIVGVAAIESSFLGQTKYLDLPYGHEDEAPLLVTIEYLTACEGHFWKKIRGLGLAYGFLIDTSIEGGRLSFVLSKSTNVVKAYEVAKEIVDDFLSKKNVIENSAFEGAKSSTMFAILSKEENYEMAGLQSLVKHIKNIGPNGNKELLKRIQKVTEEDFLRILEKYIQPLFEIKVTNLVITTNPSKIEEITKGFEKFGRKLTVTKVDDYIV